MFCVISYRPEHEEYACGCRVGTVSGDFWLKTVPTVEACIDHIVGILAQNPEADHTHLVFTRWEQLLYQGQYELPSSYPKGRGIRVIYHHPDGSFDADGEATASALEETLVKAVDEKLEQTLLRLKDEQRRKNEAESLKRQTDALKAEREQYERLRAKFEATASPGVTR